MFHFFFFLSFYFLIPQQSAESYIASASKDLNDIIGTNNFHLSSNIFSNPQPSFLSFEFHAPESETLSENELAEFDKLVCRIKEKDVRRNSNFFY